MMMTILLALLSFEEAALTRANEFIYERFNMIDNNFGDDFINHITKLDRPKIFEIISVIKFEK